MSEKSMADKLDEIQAWVKGAVPELELLNHKLTLMTADRDTLFSVHQEDEERIAALEKEKFELYEACRSMERELDSGILVTHELVQEVQDEVAKNRMWTCVYTCTQL